MPDHTSAWLRPMLEAASTLPPDEHQALLDRASMPAAEADDMELDTLTREYLPPEATVHGIDWIRFGKLLRERLGRAAADLGYLRFSR
jgi:hypothetical protein